MLCIAVQQVRVRGHASVRHYSLYHFVRSLFPNVFNLSKLHPYLFYSVICFVPSYFLSFILLLYSLLLTPLFVCISHSSLFDMLLSFLQSFLSFNIPFFLSACIPLYLVFYLFLTHTLTHIHTHTHTHTPTLPPSLPHTYAHTNIRTQTNTHTHTHTHTHSHTHTCTLTHTHTYTYTFTLTHFIPPGAVAGWWVSTDLELTSLDCEFNNNEDVNRNNRVAMIISAVLRNNVAGSTMVIKSLKRALSTSFGSICLGSLLVSTLRVLRMMVEFVTRSMRRLHNYSGKTSIFFSIIFF